MLTLARAALTMGMMDLAEDRDGEVLIDITGGLNFISMQLLIWCENLAFTELLEI